MKINMTISLSKWPYDEFGVPYDSFMVTPHPQCITQHILSTNFLEVINRPNNDTAIPQFHRRYLETQDGPSLDSSYLLIPINIPPTH